MFSAHFISQFKFRMFFSTFVADVSGSLEAIVNVLNNYHSPDLTLTIIHAAVGAVNENDLKMLQSSDGRHGY